MLIELPSLVRQSHLLIFLHGLGDTGHGWSQAFRQLQRDRLPSVRMVFPTAPKQPVTINGGYTMNSWYDIKSMDIGSNDRTASDDLDKSSQIVEQLIRSELDSGRISSSKQVILGGFSQGGAVTLHALLKGRYPVGAGIVLSSYLAINIDKAQCNADNFGIPVFWGHGIEDSVVRFKYGELSVERLKSGKCLDNISFHSYRDLDHGSCDEELEDLLQFLHDKLSLHSV